MRLDETHPLVYSYVCRRAVHFEIFTQKRSQKRCRKMHYFAILSKSVQNFTVDLVTKRCASSRRIERGAILGVIDIGDERKSTLKKSWNFHFFAFISTFYIFNRNSRTKCRNRSVFFFKMFVSSRRTCWCGSRWVFDARQASYGWKTVEKVTNPLTLISPSVTLLWYGD